MDVVHQMLRGRMFWVWAHARAGTHGRLDLRMSRHVCAARALVLRGAVLRHPTADHYASLGILLDTAAFWYWTYWCGVLTSLGRWVCHAGWLWLQMHGSQSTSKSQATFRQQHVLMGSGI